MANPMNELAVLENAMETTQNEKRILIHNRKRFCAYYSTSPDVRKASEVAYIQSLAELNDVIADLENAIAEL